MKNIKKIIIGVILFSLLVSQSVFAVEYGRTVVSSNNNVDYSYQSSVNSGYQNQGSYLIYGQYYTSSQVEDLITDLIKQIILLQNNNNYDYDDYDSEVEVETLDAEDVREDEAELRGELDINRSDYAYVWFEYGTDEDDLDEETDRKRISDYNQKTEFYSIAEDLDEDERYYFRAVGRDDEGEITKGDIENFTTDEDSNNEDEPELYLSRATDIEDDEAEISGEVDMNDFKNGVVFFVYGENEGAIEDVENDFDSYNDVDEDGDDLQKIRVDRDLDGDDEYSEIIDGLDGNTDYFYSLCVEYEDEDNDDTLKCSSVREFETE